MEGTSTEQEKSAGKFKLHLLKNDFFRGYEVIAFFITLQVESLRTCESASPLKQLRNAARADRVDRKIDRTKMAFPLNTPLIVPTSFYELVVRVVVWKLVAYVIASHHSGNSS